MNIDLKRIVNSGRGKIVISILLGLGLATLFRKACASRNCLVFKAPTLKDIKNKIFGHNNKCYTFTEQSSTCKTGSNNIIVDIATNESSSKS